MCLLKIIYEFISEFRKEIDMFYQCIFPLFNLVYLIGSVFHMILWDVLGKEGSMVSEFGKIFILYSELL